MQNKLVRTIILLMALAVYYTIMISIHWSSIPKLPFNCAYITGMVIAPLAILAERWGKHFDTPNFDWWELIRKQLLTLVIFYPIEILGIWPMLGKPKGVWESDFLVSFCISFTSVMMGTKLPTTLSRWRNKIFDTDKNGNE
ncbi:MAG: hypothetical protein A2534_00220 [Candidatus Magasanikbacteria bacterium RIFOXYD2_FULL_39_9]|nr:MAG: hypothetical protein A2534_00220 [Candidatus Magasanikbacteria bacterium RIFOXYD2_FULL_39_9]